MMKLIPIKLSAFLALLILFCLVLVTPSLARAQSGATQQLTGNVNPDEEVYYRLPNLKKGETLYILLQATSGNLDPFVGILNSGTDLKEFQTDFKIEMEATLNSDNIFQAINAVRDQYLLAWDDDSGSGYAAALTYTIPKDGDYYLVVSSANTTAWETFGDYQLSLGVNAPEVLAGSTKDTAVIAIRDDQVSPEKVAVEVITGTLTTGKLNQEYRIMPQKTGDKLSLFLEDISGDLTASIFLTDFGGKIIAIALPEEGETGVTVEYTFVEDSSNYKLGLIGCCGDYRLFVGLNAPEVLSGQAEEMGGPVFEAANPLSVGFRLQQITAVDQKAENFSAVATLKMVWKDPKLAFSPEDCHCTQKSFNQKNFDTFIQETGERWPDFTFYNQQGNRWIQNQIVDIQPDGSATYLERFSTTFQAPDFNFKKFPFDEQQFFIRMDGIFSEDIYTFQDDPLFTEMGSQLGEEEWYITDSSVAISSEKSSTANLTSRYSFGFTARRHLSFYLLRIFVPIGVVIVVSWFAFFLKDFGKRVDVASANLLLFIAFNFTISDDLPRLGYITFLDAILISTFVISAFVVVFNVVLKRLEVSGKSEQANRLDTPMIWLYPLSYVLAIALIVYYFFFVN